MSFLLAWAMRKILSSHNRAPSGPAISRDRHCPKGGWLGPSISIMKIL